MARRRTEAQGDALAELARAGAHGPSGSQMASVLREAAASVLVVDRTDQTVTFANRAALELTGGRLALPAPVRAWAAAVPLHDAGGAPIPVEETPVVQVAAGCEVPGRAVTLPTGEGPRSYWAVGLCLASPAHLRGMSLLVLFDLGTAGAGEPLGELRDRAIVATQYSFTISNPSEPDNPLIYVNPAFEAMTGYSPDEVLGRNCRFLQTDATDPAAVEQFRTAIAEERPTTVTLLNRRKDGTSFWNEVSLSPVLDGAGALTHFVGVQKDVTARVLAEASRELHYAAEQRARADAEAAQGRLAYLAEASAALDASLDVEAVVEQIASLAVPRLADACLIALAGDDQARPSVLSAGSGCGGEERLEDGAGAAARERLLALAGRAGDVRLVGWGDGDEAETQLVGSVGHAGAVVLPLVSRAKRLGTLVLLRGNGPAPADAELLLATELGRRSAAALDNAHRFRERDRIARVLQASLLPPGTPELPGAALATRYVPAGTGVEVGGDFWDAFDTGDGWGIAIGDVCGKGPDAAAVTGLARHTVRAAAMQQGEPTAVLGVLNRALRSLEGLGDRFVTACYADYVATATGAQLQLAVGGHPSPVLARDGACAAIGRPGTLLGLFDDVDLHCTEIDLVPGDVVVFVTDGILEAPGLHNRLGDRAFRDVVARAAADGLDADAIADAVVDSALRHAGGRAADDLCVVVLAIPAPR